MNEEITFHNWKEQPPKPFTGRLERSLLGWKWNLTSDGNRITGGWRLMRSHAYRDMMKIMRYAITV